MSNTLKFICFMAVIAATRLQAQSYAVGHTTLNLTDAAREHIAREGYDPVYGARPLKRYLQREVDTRLSRKLLSGDIPDSSTLTLAYKDGNLDIQSTK